MCTVTKLKKKKKNYSQVHMSLVKNSSVFMMHYIECNLSTARQQARNLGQAVEYAAWKLVL